MEDVDKTLLPILREVGWCARRSGRIHALAKHAADCTDWLCSKFKDSVTSIGKFGCDELVMATSQTLHAINSEVCGVPQAAHVPPH